MTELEQPQPSDRWDTRPIRCDDCGQIVALPLSDGGIRILVAGAIVQGDRRVVIVCDCGKRIRRRPGRQAA